jgi:hypothetical protein
MSISVSLAPVNTEVSVSSANDITVSLTSPTTTVEVNNQALALPQSLGTTDSPTFGTVTANALTMADNKKITLGAGTDGDGDLEIFHDGSHSIINHRHEATGKLFIIASDEMHLQMSNASAGTETAIKMVEDGAVQLFFDNTTGGSHTTYKLATTATGVDVNGTVTATTFIGALTGNAATATIAKGGAVIYDASNDGAIGHATVAGFVGKTVIYTNTVNGDDLTLGLPDVGADIQIGEQIHLINASSGSGSSALIILDLSESGTGQTLNICTGATVLSNTGSADPHIVAGGVATLVATADNTYVLFGSGVVDN